MLGTLRILLVMACRNIWRNPRRSLLTLSAIAAGLGSILMLAALARGMQVSMVEQAIRRLTGHIQIHTPDYLRDPAVEHSFDVTYKHLPEYLERFGVIKSALRVRVPAVIMSERESLGVTLVGIDPASEVGLSFIGGKPADGRMLESVEDNGVVLGAKLVERLQTRVGKRVVLLGTDSRNKVADRGFRIVGVFEDALEATELQYVFVGRSVAQKMLKLDGRVSELALLLADQDNLEQPGSLLMKEFPELDVANWLELEPMARVITEMQDGFLWIWFAVVTVAVGFSLVNTLFMAIFERIREIGLVQALGMRPAYIIVQVIFESSVLLLIALLVGNSLGLAGVSLLGNGIDLSAFAAGAEMAQFGRIFFPSLWLQDVLIANGLLLGVCLLASLYPAVKASRYVPVEAITRI